MPFQIVELPGKIAKAAHGRQVESLGLRGAAQIQKRRHDLGVQQTWRIGNSGNMRARLAGQLAVVHEATPRAEANSATWSNTRAKIAHFLGARDRVLAVENIGRNAGDSQHGRVALRRHDAILPHPQDQRVARFGGAQAHFVGQAYQFVRVADVAAFFEVGPHDAILDRCLQSAARRVRDQKMRAAGVGDAA